MKMDTLKSQTAEVFVEGDGVNVTCNPWANGEGVNLMVHGKDLSLGWQVTAQIGCRIVS
jgi:hypothetical protein